MQKFAAAQLDCSIGKINKNLDKHYQLIELAIKNKVDLIVFPELSITGYCREEAKRLTFVLNDDRLKNLQFLSNKGRITIIAGAPMSINDSLFIGEFIIQPNKPTKIYTKNYLHDGEEMFFEPSFDYNDILHLKEEKIALAICADIDREAHPKDAQSAGATFYLPSIFFSVNGMPSGEQKLSEYAINYNMNILMSNFCGNHWNTDAAGRTGFWSSDGSDPIQLDRENSGLVIAEKSGDQWSAKTITAIIH